MHAQDDSDFSDSLDSDASDDPTLMIQFPRRKLWSNVYMQQK